MSDSPTQVNQHFMMLVVSLQAGAMQQMGKVASPVSGKVERDLSAARATIDTLTMIEEKTSGNLTDDESKFLSSVIYQLRLNYVDETKKGDEKPGGEKPEDSGENRETSSSQSAGSEGENTEANSGNQADTESTKGDD